MKLIKHLTLILGIGFAVALCTSCVSDKPVDRNQQQCFNILHRIDLAKRSYAIGLNLEKGTELTQSQIIRLGDFLPGSSWKGHHCPLGGDYTVGKIGDTPGCSIHGNYKNPRTSGEKGEK